MKLSNDMTRGTFIVIYGINNLGKSTQIKLLVENLNQHGIKTEYVKYPIYDLEPTGPTLNQIIRGGNQTISELELQKLYTQNRADFEPTLIHKLEHGITIVAEDYTGTGLAWGASKGAALEELEQLNAPLLKENLAIVLDGRRFLEGKESNHIHESNDDLMERCAEMHRELAKKYGWITVNANDTIENVQRDILTIVLSHINN